MANRSVAETLYELLRRWRTYGRADLAALICMSRTYVRSEAVAWRNTVAWVRWLAALLLAATMVACGGPAPTTDELVDPTTELDAAPAPTPDAKPAPTTTPEAAPVPARDAGHADAATPPQEGDPIPNATPDAATPDAGTTADARPPVTTDAAPEAAPTDAGSGNANVDKANADIHRVYAQPCTPNATACGTVDHVENGSSVLLTYPLFCWAGTWGLAWNGSAVTFQCSRACSYGQLCSP